MRSGRREGEEALVSLRARIRIESPAVIIQCTRAFTFTLLFQVASKYRRGPGFINCFNSVLPCTLMTFLVSLVSSISISFPSPLVLHNTAL
jgi:branched-subunit amino acid transport protein AzlD